jgi:flagellar L-ring protein precursor FlgH
MKFILTALLLLACSELATAQSIWARRDPHFSTLFFDTGARQVGDLLTVLIRENTDVTSRDQRSLDKATSGGFNFDFAGASTAASSSANANISADSARDFQGNSQHQINREFIDRITVKIVEELPNGNLRIEGSRTQHISEERRKLVIRGTVRPQDISSSNTITSQYIADFQIGYQGCGPESHFTNQGWLGRAVSRVWPF